MAKAKAGIKGGHKLNMANARSRAIYKLENRKLRNKLRKAAKELRKAQKLLRSAKGPLSKGTCEVCSFPLRVSQEGAKVKCHHCRAKE